jgi:hypothetical protein
MLCPPVCTETSSALISRGKASGRLSLLLALEIASLELKTMSDEDLKAELERLRNENVALKKRAASDRRVLSDQRPCVSCASPPPSIF